MVVIPAINCKVEKSLSHDYENYCILEYYFWLGRYL